MDSPTPALSLAPRTILFPLLCFALCLAFQNIAASHRIPTFADVIAGQGSDLPMVAVWLIRLATPLMISSWLLLLTALGMFFVRRPVRTFYVLGILILVLKLTPLLIGVSMDLAVEEIQTERLLESMDLPLESSTE